MSYHDGYDPRNEGMSVVNPLIRIERKLDRIKKLLAQEDDAFEELTAIDLKGMIENILNDRTSICAKKYG